MCFFNSVCVAFSDFRALSISAFFSALLEFACNIDSFSLSAFALDALPTSSVALTVAIVSLTSVFNSVLVLSIAIEAC